MIILGSGPSRIDQGIEFDYFRVHAVLALQGKYDTAMVNCNPEAVSADYDVISRLYFELLIFKDVHETYLTEPACGPVAGMIMQFGGQIPLSLASRFTTAGVSILNTQARAVNLAEDRQGFERVYTATEVAAPAHGTAISNVGTHEIAQRVRFSVLTQPSYVLGG